MNSISSANLSPQAAPAAFAFDPDNRPKVRNELERVFDAMDRPASPRGYHLSNGGFQSQVQTFNSTVIGIANSDAKPNSSEARDLKLTKTASSTLNAISFGALNRAMRASEAPQGSPEVLHNAISCGARLFVAACCSATVVIPVVAGAIGLARGRAASTRTGVIRQYKHSLIQDQVLTPLNKTLSQSPSAVSPADREAVQNFLATCKKNKAVGKIVKREDLKEVKIWLADHPVKK